VVIREGGECSGEGRYRLGLQGDGWRCLRHRVDRTRDAAAVFNMNQRTRLPGYGRAGGVLKARGFSEMLLTLLHILFTVKKIRANVDKSPLVGEKQ